MRKKELLKLMRNKGMDAVSEECAKQVADLFSSASSEIINDICECMRIVGEEKLIPSDAIKMTNISRHKELNRIKSRLSKAVTGGMKEIDKMLEVLAEGNDEFAAVYYKTKNKKRTTIKNSKEMQSAMRAAAKTMKKDLINMSETTMITFNDKTMSLDKGYVRMVNQASLAVQQGYTDYNTAIRSTVRKMAMAGVKTAVFKSGYKVRMDSQARMNILEGARKFNMEYRMLQGEAFGADGVEISVHSACAPDHIDIQGKQFSNKEFEKLQNTLKRPIGTLNCTHSIFPIVLGISRPAYTDKELEYIKNMSEEKIEYTDSKGIKRQVSGYEATQVQRKLEVQIRRLKDTKNAFVSSGDELMAKEYKKKITKKTKEYNRISKELGLRPKDNKLRVVNVGGGSLKNTRKDDIITLKTSQKLSKHSLERIEERNVTLKDIENTIENPLHISDTKIDEKGRKSKRYIGEKATVNINPDTNNITTVWKTGKRVIKKYSKRGEE